MREPGRTRNFGEPTTPRPAPQSPTYSLLYGDLEPRVRHVFGRSLDQIKHALDWHDYHHLDCRDGERPEK